MKATFLDGPLLGTRELREFDRLPKRLNVPLMFSTRPLTPLTDDMTLSEILEYTPMGTVRPAGMEVKYARYVLTPQGYRLEQDHATSKTA